MEQKESSNLSNDALFNVIKDKCKSKAKFHFYSGLMWLFLVITGVIYCGYQVIQYNFDIEDVAFFVALMILGCAVIWFVLYNYRFLQKIDTLDTPDKLLYQYDKKIRHYPKIFSIFIWVLGVSLFNFSNFSSQHLIEKIVRCTILIVLVAVCIYLFFKSGYMSRSDKEIIEQLQELTKK